MTSPIDPELTRISREAAASQGTTTPPDSLTHEQIRGLAETLGFHDLDDLTAIHLDTHGCTVTYIARNPEGHRYLGADGEVATHTLSIPVRDG